MYICFLLVFPYLLLLLCCCFFGKGLKLLVANGVDVIDFKLVGKTIRNFFRLSTHNYIYDKKLNDPSTSTVAPLMVAKLNRNWTFKLRFSAFRVGTNRCEIIITNIFDDNIVDDTNLQPRFSCTLTETTAQPIYPRKHLTHNHNCWFFRNSLI